MTTPVLRAGHSRLRSGIFSCSINNHSINSQLGGRATFNHRSAAATLRPQVRPADNYSAATNQVNDESQSANYFVTHSESDTEGEYHTDSTFDAEPERYFLLYVNQAARCGGELSRVRSNAAVIRYLQNSADGQPAAATLRNRLFPFRIPSAFPGGGSAASTYIDVPIPTGTNTIRWRPDTLAKGLEDSPDFDTPDVRAAAKQLMHGLEHAPEELAMNLQDDSMVLVDNHRAVHARTAFRDRERSLFRARFHSKKCPVN